MTYCLIINNIIIKQISKYVHKFPNIHIFSRLKKNKFILRNTQELNMSLLEEK